MQEFVVLLNALWPYAILIAVVIMALRLLPQARMLLPKLTYAKILGVNELKFEREAKEITLEAGTLAKSIAQAVDATSTVRRAERVAAAGTPVYAPSSEDLPPGVLDWARRQELVRDILAEAVSNPTVALIRVSFEVEQSVLLLAGVLKIGLGFDNPGIDGAERDLRGHPNPSFSKAGSTGQRFIGLVVRFLDKGRDDTSPQSRSIEMELLSSGISLLCVMHTVVYVVVTQPELFNVGVS